jgi:hypothetical protein
MAFVGYTDMLYRLAEGAQVRKESWGILFYTQAQHRVCFVGGGDWLHPRYFDGTWTFDSLVGDVAKRMGTSAKAIEPSIQKLTARLLDSGMIVNELC